MARAPHTHLVSTASPRRVSHAQLGLTEVDSTTADPSLGFYLHKRPAGGDCSLHPSGLRCSAQKGSRPARSSRARKAKFIAGRRRASVAVQASRTGRVGSPVTQERHAVLLAPVSDPGRSKPLKGKAAASGVSAWQDLTPGCSAPTASIAAGQTVPTCGP